MTNLKKLAERLRDGKPYSSKVLVDVAGHRFGAALLQLRKGEYDGRCWEVAGWRSQELRCWCYQLMGFTDRYEPASPTCPKCGHKLHAKDVRKEA